MKKSWRLVSLTATVIGLMALCQDLLAQDAAPLFRERFANVFDPESRTYFSLQGTEGKQFGGQQPYASLGATHYTGSIEDAVTLYSGQFMMNYNAITGNPAGTLGAQQRWLLNLPLLDRSILGAGLYLDFSQSRYNNLFQQLNVNLELYTESAWLARGNLYLPVGQNQQYTGLSSVSGGAPGQLSVVGTTVGTGGTIHQWMDVALMGTDLELGRKLFNYRMEVYGSYYTWNGPLAGFTNGAKAGVRGYLTNNLSGNLNVSHDQFFGTNVYSGVTYFFGGSGGNRPMSFENLMTLPAQRSQQVSISNYSRNQDTFRALHDKITGDELHLYFVKEDGTGLGTQVNPSNVTAVEGNSHFGAGSAMVLLDANGNITTPVTLAHDRQQLVGGGSTGTADIDFSLALGEPAGTSVVHLSNLGGRPVLAPPSGNAVNLSANQTVIKGFTIDGAGGLTAGVVGLPQISDTVINDLLVRNVNGVGIQLDPAKHSSVTNITFNNNGTDLVLSDSNSTTNTISNITSTGAKNGSLMLGHGAFGLTGTTNVSNVTISGAGGFGGIEINNAKSGSTTNLNNISITGGTGSGVTVANSQTGSLYNLTNVDILRTGNTGISLLNSNGTFNVDNGSSIANTGSAGLDVNGGAIDVNFNGSITQTLSDASAVYATGSHSGTVIFGTGSSIHTTIGNGLQFDSADGTYKFLGSITMNGGDAGIDIFNSNGNFTFNNPFINNTASGMAVKIVGGGGDAPITTFNGLSITTNSNTGFFVANGGLTTVNGTANVDTKFGTAVDLSGTALATVFTNIKSDQSPTSGIRIDNATGTFGVTGNATVTGAAGSGISITNSHTLSTGLQKVTINSIGTSGADNGITLSDAGTVTILGGTINGTTGDGIHSSDTNLSVVGVNIGGLSAVNGDGVEIINNGSPHLINLGGNTIKGNASGVSTRDSGVAGELVLLLNQNTLESVNSGSLALSVLGGGLNSTIIQSMSGDTVIGNGTGGGVLFNQVTFDASGSSLSGTQVNAGNWTIGTPAGRVHGDGLHFDAPTGNLKFGTLNIANNGGDGLFVDAKTLGTTFTLSNTGGTIDTTSGSALNLDPLTANLTFSSVSSTGSAGNGITLNTVSGSLNIGALTVSSAAGNGVDMSNSSATVGIGQLNINGAVEGVNLLNNTGSFTVNTGGTIQNVTDRGVLAVNTVSTSLNNMTIDATGGTRGVGVLTTSGNNTFRLTNSTVLGGSEQAVAVGADGAGVLTAVINGNTLTGIANNPQGAGFVGITSATGASGGTLNLIFNGNTLSSVASAGAYISDYNPNTSTTGGTVTIAGFANNTVTTSNAGNASTPLTGGILVNGATFDGDLLTAGIQAVNGGTLTIGDPLNPSSVSGDGLQLNDVSGVLTFTNVNISNNDGTGLYVNTKLNNTTFQLTNSDGAIHTTNGAAMVLDPLTAYLTFNSVSSTNSSTDGVTLDTVGGYVNLGNTSVTNAAGSGISMVNSSAGVTTGNLDINGAATGLTFGHNTNGTFIATGTTNISNVTGTGINLNGATGYYQFADLNVSVAGAQTGLDFRNSNVQFSSGNTTITGDGAAGSVAIDLSGSLNPHGANSSTANILLGSGAGETAIINNVGTGVLMGNVIDGSAGANFVYGNQTPLNSGSQINVIAGGTTLDTTHLISSNTLTQGQYNFLGVGFTGLASFQKSNDLLFVGSTSGGGNTGATPTDRISVAELLALDANPANLDGKTIVLVNDNGGLGLDLGANSLVLGNNTILDSFGNGQTFSSGGAVPVNVIVDTVTSPLVFSDPNGAATLTNDGSVNLVVLGNNDTIQDLNLNGGLNAISGTGISGFNLNHTTISGSGAAAVTLTNTSGVIGITQTNINSAGTQGISLNNAGTVSISGVTIDGVGDDGIHSIDTNLTVTGTTIGGTSPVNGDGIEVVNNGSPHTINISNNTITANASGITTRDSGNSGELILTLDGNTLQSKNAGSLALDIGGGGLNSTIIQSMNGGTVIGNGTGGGVSFTQVTFDASGAALSGTQVDAGNWTIGTAGNRVQGDGLSFKGPTGDLKFGALNVANNNGNGIFVDTKTLGSTFTLGNTSGSVDTTNGTALNLDPLTVNMTLDTVSSTNGSNGIILSEVAGSLTINSATVTNSSDNGVSMQNSLSNVTIGNLTVNGAANNGVYAVNNGGSLTINSGTIDSVGGAGVQLYDTNGVINGVTLTNFGSNGFVIGAVNGPMTATVTNNSISQGGSNTGITLFATGPGDLTATVTGNNIHTDWTSLFTSLGAGGSVALNASSNTLQSDNFLAAQLDGTNGSLTITGFADNTVAGAKSTAVSVNAATFDADTTTAGIQTVSGGNTTIGSLNAPGNIAGQGLSLYDVSGALSFGTLNIGNNGDSGLSVDTTPHNTAFTLSTAAGSINTTNGTAIALQSVATDLNLSAVSSSGSLLGGLSLNGVTGQVNLGTVNVTNTSGNGVDFTNSTADATIHTLNVNGAVNGVNLQSNASGSFRITGTGAAGSGGQIQNVTSRGILAVDNSSLSVNNMIIDASGGTRGIGVLATNGTDSFTLTNSTVTGGSEQAVGIGADLTGLLNATVTGNTLTGTGPAASAGAFGAITSAADLSGGTLNLAFSGNSLSSQSSAGAYISHYNPLSSTTGGAVTITNFANNTVTSSNANGSSSPITGGILINGATFDADLSTAGIQTVNGGSLTIGSQATPTNVVGDGLQLNDVTGKLTFTTLNISNDNGTGLYVNTKINNTTFSLTNSAGSINTTNGAAMNLDPLTANLTFSSVASASSAGNGLTLDTVAGSVNIGAVQINSAAGNGVDMSNSSANVTIGQLNVNQATVGLNLLNNAGGSFTVTGSGGVGGGGTIQNVTAQGVLVSDTLSTSLNNMIIDASTGTRGVDVTATTGANAFTLSNSIVTGGSDQAVRVGADDTGLLNASVTNNTLAGIGPSDDGAAFWGVTSANGNSGGTLNLAFSGNTMSSMTAAGAVISTFEPDSFTQGGTINVVDFANNTVLTSNSGNASGPFTGGIITLGVTFDSDLNTAGYQAVDGGNLTIGSLGSPTDIGGAGLVLYDVRGNLQFSNVNIGNDSGTGLFVDTKTNNTTFNLSNTGGAINTTNGDALYLDPLTANLTFSSVSATDAGRAGITLDGVAGSVNLGAMTVSDNTDAGLFMDASSATVTAASVTVANAPVGLSFGNNTGSFTVTGATSLTGITFDGIDLYQATGTYQFGDVTIGMTGDAYGLDFGRSNVVFSSANTTITGDGTLDSVGIDLSGSLNPFGANSTTSNIRVGTGAGQTAIINNVDTGVLMGSSADGSAGAYLVYGNQTPHNSGSQINVIASGLTLDTTHLTSSDGYTQGRYEFLGVSFTGTASFQQSNNMIFVGSTSAGKDDGSSPLNRIDGAQLLALDANPANLDGKTIILVNDNGGAGIDLGGSSLVLGNNTVLDSFGNGKTFTTNGTVPVNVIVDTITGGITISDPNGAGTLLNNGTADLVIAGNGDTIQNVILNGGFNTVSASGINGFDINHTVIGGSSAAGISLSNTTGTINLNQNTISNVGAAGILLSNAGTVGIAGGSIDGTGDDGIHSTDTNLTVTGMTIGGVASITGDGIEIRNNGSAHIVNLSNNLITGDASAITTRDSGVAGELLLTLDGNTLKSVNSGTLALDIGGGGLNSTIIQSMNGGTILGGTGGGASFSQVTFDASGTSLSGTQLNAGSWTIGTTSSRVQGAGLQFTSPTGDLTFSSLNVANNNGTGLSVDTKSLGTIFTLGTSGGTVDTTNGAALFLDPLNVNMTLGSVSSTNSSSAGVTLDTVGGTLSIGVTNISGSGGDGILAQNNFKTLNANFGSTTVDSASGDSINLSGDGNFTFGTTNITNRNNIGINTNGTGGTIQFGTTTIDNPNAAGDAVVLQNSNGGSTTFDSLTISNAGGIGLSAIENAFDVNITNTLTVDGSGTQAVYLSGNSGNFTVGGLTSLGVTTANSGTNFQIHGGTGNVTLGGLTVGNRDQQGIRISNGFAGAANFNGTTTIGAPTSATSAIDISGLAATGSATFNNLALDNTGATSSLINLTDNTTGSVTINAGTLSNLAGGIGISNTNTSLTVNSLTINGTGTQDGIYLTNNDATSRSVTLSNISSTSGSIGGAGIYVDMSTSTSSLAVNLSGNSIIAGDSALRVWESAAAPVANTVQVNLTGTNTWQSLNPVNTLDFAGQNIGADNSTIVITSLGNGTITANGTNGGVNFGSVAFDSDLSTAGNQQVSAGNWNIGQGTGANQRVQGIGLNFADPAGSAAFTTLNIYNNNDSGLNVDTNDFGTNFALATAAGTVDTTNGTALYLDPLAANLTFDQVSSTNSSTDGVTVALMSGTLNITNLQVTGASNNGLEIEASSSLTTTIQSVTISNTFNGINLVNAGAVSILGGTIDSTSGDGIHSFDTNLTAQSLNIGGTGAVTGDGIEIVNSSGAQVVNLSNNTIKANASGISTTDSAAAKALLLTLDGNTLQAVNPGNLALSVKGNGLNSTIIKSMNGGTIIGNGASGGAKFNRVTFDASGTALTGTQVAAGNWTVGTSAARVQGDGLRFDGTTGDLKFGTLNVGNNNGTGLYVDTKTLGTTFTLANAGGSVDTTSGSAMFLDPLTSNLTFGTVNTTGSAGNGVTFDTVGGSVSIGSLTVSNAALDGVLVKNSTGSFTITGGSIGGAGTNSFEVSGGSATVNYGGTIATSTDYSVLIDSTTGGSATFGGTITDNGSAKGIRLTNNSGDATFNGNVSLGATTALTQEALYLTNNTGNIKFGNVDITVNSATAQGAIYGLSDSSVVIGSGSVNATGAAAVNLDQSKIDMTFSGITSSGGTDGLALTNLLSGSVLKSTTTTISNVTQTAVGLSGSQGDFSLGTLGINGAKTGIDFRNSNLSFTSGNTTITGDGSAGSVAIDLSGTQNPYGANSTTPNIKLADVAGQTAIINSFGTGVLLGNAIDGSAGANFIYGDQTPLNSGSQINVISGGVTLDGTHLVSTAPYTQGRYEFMGVAFTGNTTFPSAGADLLFVGSVSGGAANGSSPTDRISIAQLLALDATPANLDGKTIVFVNDGGAGGGTSTIGLGAASLTLGTGTIVDTFGNGRTFSNGGIIAPVNVIVDTIAGTTYTDPFSNGAATLTNTGAFDLITLGNGDTVQNITLNSSGLNDIYGSGVAGVNVNNTTFGGLPGGSAINLVNTTGTITLDSNIITNSGDSGIQLSNAGTVSITNGSIDNTSWNGIDSLNTNLTVSGVTFGATSAIGGSAVSITNNDAVNRTISLQNLTSTSTSNINGNGILINSSGAGTLSVDFTGNSIAATLQALRVNETAAVAAANTVQLAFNGTNTWSNNSANYAVQLTGQNVDATNSSIVITSLADGAITANGVGGGVSFNGVTFDSDLGTAGNQQVVAGSWNIGQGSLAAQRVQGDGLRFDAPAGDVSFTTLNIFNNNGTGLYVDTKTAGTTFNLGTGTGTIDTTNGSAMFLDPLSTSMTLASVSSTNSSSNGVTLDTVSGTLSIGNLTIDGATASGLWIDNSAGLTSTFTTVAISNIGTLPEDSGVNLTNAGTVSILGGTIDGTTGDGIHTEDSNLLASGLTIGGVGAITGDGVHIASIAGSPHTVTISNNSITSNGLAISSVDSGAAGELVLSLDGNTVQSTGSLAINVTGSALNSTIVKSMNGGTVVGNGAGGGVIFQQVTFDASGSALLGTQVDAGNWTIGTVANRVSGDGLQLYYPTGDLKFGDLNIANITGTGLFVDTKTLGTTFSLSNTGGTIDTANGSAIYLDPLTTHLTFDTISSTNSFTTGVTLDTIDGTFTVNGTTTVSNAGSHGVLINNNSGTVTFGDVNIDTTGADGVHISNNTGAINFIGTTTIQSTTGDGIDLASAGGGVNFGTTDIIGANANGINLTNATGDYTFGTTTINGFGTNKTGIDFTGAAASATFGVTNIQNGGFGTAIDLSSTTGDKTITFQTGSSISNVNLGVQLSSSNTAATTANANFTFGDGDGADPNGANSTIDATTTVNAVGLNSASGSYNFNDVTFTGTANLPGASGGALFVSATAADGVGNGSYSNPYSVADADAITTAGAQFVFLDGTYNFATLNGGHAFTLSKNQSVEGLDNGNTVTYGTVQPANIQGNLGAVGGVASRTSSLSITDGAAGGIFDLAGGNTLLDLTMSGSALTTYLINANGNTVGFDNTNGITLNGLTLSNAAGNATALQFTDLTGTVQVTGNNINMGSGKLLDLSGGTATYTIAKGTQPDPGSTTGVLNGNSIRVRNMVGGSLSLDGMSLSGAGTLVTLDNNAASFSFANNSFAGGAGSTLFDIDNNTGGSITSLVFDNTNTITQTNGTIATIGSGNRSIDLSAFDFTNTGTTNSNVIRTASQSGGTIKFGNINIVNFNNAAGTAVLLGGSGGTAQFGDLDIAATNGAGLNVGAITFNGGATPTISTSNGAALAMNGTMIAGGAMTFGSLTSNGGSNGISLTNVIGNTTFTTVNIDNSTGDGISLSNSGLVTLNGGTIDGTTNDGIHSSNTNLILDGLTIGGSSAVGGDGAQIVNSASKTVAISNTTVADAAGTGITISGSGGGTTTITAFDGNSTLSAGAGGVVFDTVTFDSNTGLAGIQQVSGGTLTIGDLVTTTNVTGDGLVLNHVLGDIAFTTLNIGNDNGTGLYIRDAAGKGGSFAFGNTGGTINTTNGSAMDIDPVTMNSTFAAVRSTNANGQGISTAGNGINLNTVTGNVTINGGSISGATAGSFVVNGGNANITYKGDITNTAGYIVEVENTTGGSVTFDTGTLSDSGTGGNSGLGIFLFNNAGNTSFTGNTLLTDSDASGIYISGGSGTNTFGPNTSITNASLFGFLISGGTASATYSGNITETSGGSGLVSAQGGHSLGTVTFDTGTLKGSSGNGLFFNNADGTYNFNGVANISNAASISIDNGSSGTFQFGTNTTVTNSTSDSFYMNNSSANVTFDGAIGQNTASAVVRISNQSAGTVTFSSGAIIVASNGSGIQLDNVDGTVNFLQTIAILGGQSTGFSVTNGSSGTILVSNSGFLIQNPTAYAYYEDTSTANVTFNGSIQKTNNGFNAILINNKTGGTTTFGGAITATNGSTNAINLTSNTGGTINFANTSGTASTIATTSGNALNFTGGGTLNFTGNKYALSSGAGTAFNATAGTVTATGTGNTLSSSSGTALNVSNATIGANNLTFQSISSGSGSNTTANGIVLDTTGTLGGLIVTGTGSAGSGGTIQHKTGSDGSATQGTGIYLNNTSGVSLSYMQLNDFQNFGIRGFNVTGFSMDHTVINGSNGTNSAGGSREGAVFFDGLYTTGSFAGAQTASITNSTIGGVGGGDQSYSDNLRIVNTSGTLNRLTINNTSFGNIGSSGNDSLSMQASNSAVMNVTVTNSTFTNAIGSLVHIIDNNSSSSDIVFRNNTLSNNNVNQASGGSGLYITGDSVGTATTVTYDISHNTIRDSIGDAMIVAKGNGKGTWSGTINANTIGVNGVSLSGSSQASGIKVYSGGTGSQTVLISNNIIYQTNETGILIQANDSQTAGNGGGQGVMNVSVFGNQVLQPGSFQFAGLDIDVGAVSGDNTIVNVVVGSANTAGQKNDFSAGDPSDFSDVNFSQQFSTVINLSKNGSSGSTADVIIQDNNLNGINTTTAVSGSLNYVTTLPALPPVVAP